MIDCVIVLNGIFYNCWSKDMLNTIKTTHIQIKSLFQLIFLIVLFMSKLNFFHYCKNANTELIIITRYGFYLFALLFALLNGFAKWYDRVEVQLNTDVYSSFATIYINLVITVILIKVCLGGVRMLEVAWRYLIYVARVVQKLGLV